MPGGLGCYSDKEKTEQRKANCAALEESGRRMHCNGGKGPSTRQTVDGERKPEEEEQK